MCQYVPLTSGPLDVTSRPDQGPVQSAIWTRRVGLFDVRVAVEARTGSRVEDVYANSSGRGGVPLPHLILVIGRDLRLRDRDCRRVTRPLGPRRLVAGAAEICREGPG